MSQLGTNSGVMGAGVEGNFETSEKTSCLFCFFLTRGETPCGWEALQRLQWFKKQHWESSLPFSPSLHQHSLIFVKGYSLGYWAHLCRVGGEGVSPLCFYKCTKSFRDTMCQLIFLKECLLFLLPPQTVKKLNEG